MLVVFLLLSLMITFLCYDLAVNVFKMISLLFHTSLFQNKIILSMFAKYELICHKELNMFDCFCGYMALFHHCTKK